MDMAAFFKVIDKQIKEREKRTADRRQQQQPVAEERRSGQDRRGRKRS